MAHLHAYRRTPGGAALYYGWFEAMHSRADIMLCGVDEARGGEVLEAIADEVLRIERRLNRFDPASDIGRLNGSPAGWYDLDAEIADIIADTARLRSLTLGMFDIAIQTPGFSVAGGAEYYIPGDGGVELLRDGVVLDLGGYAKGYALERIRALLWRLDISDALVSLGNSSVLGLGNPPGPDGRPSAAGWRIGIENPLGGEPLGVVSLRGDALSTSGNNLHNEGHIRSPLTGAPATGRRMVSVVAPSGSDAEALSTALMAAPAELRPQIEANFPQTQVLYFEY